MKKFLKLVFIFFLGIALFFSWGTTDSQTSPAKIDKPSYRIKEYKMDSLKFKETKDVKSADFRKRVVQSRDKPAILLTDTLDIGENTLLAASWKTGSKLKKATIRSAQKSRTQLGELEYDPLEGPDTQSKEYKRSASQNKIFSEFVWTGKTDKVLLEIEIPARSKLEDFRLYAIHIPDKNKSLISRAENKIKSLISFAWASPKPAIITRQEWGADESLRKDDPEYASELKKAIIHHTAGSNDYSKEQSAQIVRGIYTYHTQVKGWNDIGYNFLVDKYGQVFEGRYGGMDKNVAGAHAQGFNSGSTGAAVIGNFISTSPPVATQDSLVSLLGWRLSEGVVNPDGSGEFNGKNLSNIIGHRDVGSTACPGNKLHDFLPVLRRATDPLIHAVNKGVSPSSAVIGYDRIQYITSVYVHANGANNITSAEMLINNEASPPHNNTMLAHYKDGKLYLYSDDGSRLIGGIAPGTKGAKIENSKAILDVERTTVSFTGNELRIKWAIKAKFSFLGKKNVYLLVKDKEGNIDGWDKLGSLTVSLNSFKGEYFNNISLSGASALTKTYSAINFDWGGGSPASGISSDNFSARWTGQVELPAGIYKFTATTDDGVRLWVDGKLIIDKWKDQAPTSYTAEVNFSSDGKHDIKMEYYERGGGAVAKLGWQKITTTTIYGRGWGHGIGMSQWGARDLAECRSYSYKQILTHYFQNTSISAFSEKGIAVYLKGSLTSVTITGSGGSFTIKNLNGEIIATGNTGETWEVKRIQKDNKWYYQIIKNGNSIGNYEGPIRFVGNSDSVILSLDGAQYRGNLTFYGHSPTYDISRFYAVNRLPLESYVWGVAEVPSSWHSEALKAQAAAARTYAYRRITEAPRHDNFDIYSTVDDQVYLGYSKEKSSPSWVTAVNNTKERIITYNGKVAEVFYHAESGGHTENNEDVWGGTPRPYLRGVRDDYRCGANPSPRYSWNFTFTNQEIKDKVERYSNYSIKIPGNLVSMKIIDRNGTRRVKTVRLYGSNGYVDVRGTTFYTALGLYSRWFWF